MKKIGILIFIVAAIAGVVLAKMFSFGSFPAVSLPQVSFFSKVKGSGNTKVEKRNVADFKAIDVGGAYAVEIKAGADYSLEVEADDNILPLITTSVDNGTLRIESEKRFSTRNRVKIRITAPDIRNADVSGASSLVLTDVSNEKLVIETSGASSAKISGSTANLVLDMSGASRIDAGALNAKVAIVDGSGASSAKLNVTEKLSADLSGASRVAYKGNPESLEKNLSGGSSVRQEN